MSKKKVFLSSEYGDVNEAVVGAFSYCRDVDHPVVVMIDNHKCKLFPSGRIEDLHTGKVNNQIDWGEIMKICPRCLKPKMHDEEAMNSLSRRASVYICNDCGDEEALIDFGTIEPTELEKAFVAKVQK